MEILVVDPEISLKIRNEDDAARTFALIEANRDYLKQWLPWVDGVKTVQDCNDFINLNRSEFAEDKAANYGIFYHGELVGLVGFHPFDRANKSVTIGYWLAAEYQGKGIMIRAVGHLVNHAFNHLKLHRVEIRAALGNSPSRRIPEKLGFIQEGVARDGEFLYDHYVDLVSYAKLNTD